MNFIEKRGIMQKYKKRIEGEKKIKNGFDVKVSLFNYSQFLSEIV